MTDAKRSPSDVLAALDAVLAPLETYSDREWEALRRVVEGPFQHRVTPGQRAALAAHDRYAALRDAREIVRSHDALVGACRAALDFATGEDADGHYAERVLAPRLRAALALAGEAK